MGVRELWPILEPVGQPVTLNDLQGKKVAIDLSIWIRESDVIQAVGKPYLRNIFWRVLHLLRHQVTPVFVVEGAPPALKNAELERRLHGTPRKKASPAPPQNFSPRGKNAKFEEQIRESCELLEALGVCYVHSDGEAEATCAQLNTHGVVDGCVTQDGDAFLFGAHTVYRNFTCNSQKADQMCAYHMKDVHRDLGLTRRHLVSLALLLGCDYYNGVKSVGRKYAEDFMKEIKGHDPIQKLKELRTGSFYQSLTTLGRATKRRHCPRCQHPGSKDVHHKQGCNLCKTEGSCHDNTPDHPCVCPFHADRRQLAEHAAGVKIYRHVQHDADFPPQKVIDAFLEPSYRAPDHELEWRKPSVEKLQMFNRQHLQWGQEKVEARFVPLFTAWDLSHPWDTSLLPLRILKIFHDHGQKMIEVEWKYEDESLQIGRKEAVMTKEFYDVMSDVHPDLVCGFEAEQKKTPKSAKTPAKRKMLKAAAECRTITDMLKPKKSRIEAAAGKPNEDITEPTKETLHANGKHSAKHKDLKQRTEAAVGRADDVVEFTKRETQGKGNHSARCKDTKPGARVSLFSRFEGLLQKDGSIETSPDEDSNELPALSIVLGNPGSIKTPKKTIDQQDIVVDGNHDDHDVSVLKTSVVPILVQSNKAKTALNNAESSAELSTENGGPDAKSPIDTIDMVETKSVDSLELILDTSSESSVAMETAVGAGVSRKREGHNEEGRNGEGCNAEGRNAEGHTDESYTAEGYIDEGHTDEGHKDEGHATGPANGGDGVAEVCSVDIVDGSAEDSNADKPSLEKKLLGGHKTEGPTKVTRNGRNVDQGSAMSNGGVRLGRVLEVRLEKVDEGGVLKHYAPAAGDLTQDRGATRRTAFITKGTVGTLDPVEMSDKQDGGSASLEPQGEAEIINLGDEGKEAGEGDSDGDIFVIKQSRPETSLSAHQNGAEEEDELPWLRQRAARKEPVMKPKVKTRSKKKLKDCPGQPKIRDMFSVKKQTDGKGLKMVLVRKSDL